MARILIVDDAAFVRLTLREILEKAGHRVVGEAADGKEAVEVYQNCLPDITLLDITMPEANGIYAVQEIRKINPNAKCVMVSAMGQQTMVVEAMQAGALDFVVKPFKPDRVLESIDIVLKRPDGLHR